VRKVKRDNSGDSGAVEKVPQETPKKIEKTGDRKIIALSAVAPSC